MIIMVNNIQHMKNNLHLINDLFLRPYNNYNYNNYYNYEILYNNKSYLKYI